MKPSWLLFPQHEPKSKFQANGTKLLQAMEQRDERSTEIVCSQVPETVPVAYEAGTGMPSLQEDTGLDFLVTKGRALFHEPGSWEASVRLVTHAVEARGWQILAAEINEYEGKAFLEIRRHDGLNLVFSAVPGKASVTRERVNMNTLTVGRKGDRCRVQRMSTEFLGRKHYGTAAAGLLGMCEYIRDNTRIPMGPGTEKIATTSVSS